MTKEVIEYWMGFIMILILGTLSYLLMSYVFPLNHLSWLSTIGAVWMIVSLRVGVLMYFNNR